MHVLLRRLPLGERISDLVVREGGWQADLGVPLRRLVHGSIKCRRLIIHPLLALDLRLHVIPNSVQGSRSVRRLAVEVKGLVLIHGRHLLGQRAHKCVALSEPCKSVDEGPSDWLSSRLRALLTRTSSNCRSPSIYDRVRLLELSHSSSPWLPSFRHFSWVNSLLLPVTLSPGKIIWTFLLEDHVCFDILNGVVFDDLHEPGHVKELDVLVRHVLYMIIMRGHAFGPTFVQLMENEESFLDGFQFPHLLNLF